MAKLGMGKQEVTNLGNGMFECPVVRKQDIPKELKTRHKAGIKRTRKTVA